MLLRADRHNRRHRFSTDRAVRVPDMSSVDGADLLRSQRRHAVAAQPRPRRDRVVQPGDPTVRADGCHWQVNWWALMSAPP